MRRVVVTGLGMVTPLACGVEETWSRLLAGQSGAGPITRFDPVNVVTQYACEIPMGDGSDGTFNPDEWMDAKDRRRWMTSSFMAWRRRRKRCGIRAGSR